MFQACLENKKLEGEEDGTHIDYGDGARDCQMKMNRLQAMPLETWLPSLASDWIHPLRFPRFSTPKTLDGCGKSYENG